MNPSLKKNLSVCTLDQNWLTNYSYNSYFAVVEKLGRKKQKYQSTNHRTKIETTYIRNYGKSFEKCLLTNKLMTESRCFLLALCANLKEVARQTRSFFYKNTLLCRYFFQVIKSWHHNFLSTCFSNAQVYLR